MSSSFILILSISIAFSQMYRAMWSGHARNSEFTENFYMQL